MARPTFDVLVQLVEESCCNCGTVFAMNPDLQKARRESGGSFYCPNGHGMQYKEPEVEKLKREKAAMQEKYFAEQRKNEELTREKDRIESRVSKGVCPCCKRTFTNVGRHMKTKHPEFPAPKETL